MVVGYATSLRKPYTGFFGLYPETYPPSTCPMIGKYMREPPMGQSSSIKMAGRNHGTSL